jgi:hypothetical protein
MAALWGRLFSLQFFSIQWAVASGQFLGTHQFAVFHRFDFS